MKILVLILTLSIQSFAGTIIDKSISMTETINNSPRVFARTYKVYVPNNIQKYRPLLFVLPGGGGDSESIRRLTFNGFEPFADAGGFAIVYPQALGKELGDKNVPGWNDGRGAPSILSQVYGIHDMDFIRLIASELTKEFDIDPSKIYMTGPSNGGFMTYHFMCEDPNFLAAGAPVISSIAVPEDQIPSSGPLPIVCQSTVPVPALIINGTLDKFVRMEGGPVLINSFGISSYRGTAAPVMDSVSHFAALNSCQGEISTDLPNLVSNDAATVTRHEYQCQTPLTFYEIKGQRLSDIYWGGGHQWPGGYDLMLDTPLTGFPLIDSALQREVREQVGVVPMDIVAHEVIGNFFVGKSRPLKCSAVPRLTCESPKASSLDYSVGSKPSRNSLRFSATLDPKLPHQSVGDPLVDSDFALCVYDENETLIGEYSVDSELEWKSRTTGYSYDSKANLTGVKSFDIRLLNKLPYKFAMVGSGEKLRVPTLPARNKITTILQNKEGSCWRSDFTKFKRNYPQKFSAAI